MYFFTYPCCNFFRQKDKKNWHLISDKAIFYGSAEVNPKLSPQVGELYLSLDKC